MMPNGILISLLTIVNIIQRRYFKHNKMKNNIRLVMSEIITKL